MKLFGGVPIIIKIAIWGFLKLGVGPNNKDHSILGSILGSPYFGKLPYLGVYVGGPANFEKLPHDLALRARAGRRCACTTIPTDRV